MFVRRRRLGVRYRLSEGRLLAKSDQRLNLCADRMWVKESPWNLLGIRSHKDLDG